MGRDKMEKKKPRLPPFVATPWVILNSKAYKDLPASAAKALPYFLGRPKVPFSDGRYLSVDFTFSYPEGMTLNFAKGTWAKVLRDLVEFGFIDPVSKGGLKGMGGKALSVFRLSSRWQRYGENDFEPIDLKTFGT